jgi:hypothetical protein
MKTRLLGLGIVILAFITAGGEKPLAAAVFPQAGFEMYLGPTGSVFGSPGSPFASHFPATRPFS